MRLTLSLPPSHPRSLSVSLSLKLFGQGSLEVKLPTIWADEKQRLEESEKRREEKEKTKKEKASEERRPRCAKR